MSDELIVSKNELVSMIENRGISEIIKPLVKEVHLFDTYVAGTSHVVDKDVVKNAKLGDELLMRREENKYDAKAILLLNHENKKIGYVPEKDNIIFSRLLDAGKLLKAKIYDIEQKGSFRYIRIHIYLVDF